MKKIAVFLTGAFILLLSIGANAQEKKGADFFAGKWNVLIKGTPNGDSKMIVSLEKKDSTMTGAIQDTTGKETTKITSVEVKDNQVTFYFTAQGYDVSIVLDKKDEDHLVGSLLGMFVTEADRIKETK